MASSIADRSRLPMGILLAMVVVGCLLILRPFLTSLIWTVILVYVTWPIYRLLRSRYSHFKNVAALVMTLLLTCALIIPVLWLTYLVSAEMTSMYRLLETHLAKKPSTLPEFVRQIPWLGDLIARLIDQLPSNATDLNRTISDG
jgi:predicted PurR-regulated permease PerM